MKFVIKKKLALIIVLTVVLMNVLAPIQAAAAPGYGARTTGVNGRILTTDKTGDYVDWIEVAQNGNYSLIVRKDVLPIGTVCFPSNSYPTSTSYSVSNARNTVNNWFKNTLPANARIRDFTVRSDAASNTGAFASLSYGVSSPNGVMARTGDDIAFCLSFAEAASFCSMQYANSLVSWTSSPANARSNFGKLTQMPTIPSQRDFWWTRSPGHSGTTVSSVGTHAPAMTSCVWASVCTTNPQYVYLRPALWVGDGVFDTKFATTVNYYKDSVSAGNFLGSASLPPAVVGTVITGVNTSMYVPEGYVAPGAQSGDTVVAARDNIVNVVYSKGTYPVIVSYYSESISGTNLLGTDLITGLLYGDTIGYVDLYKYALPGHNTPGVRSGDTVVAARVNYVNVVYSMQTSLVYVFYYKDAVGTDLITSEFVTLYQPIGTPITGIDVAKYLPDRYRVPSTLIGDTVTKDPFSVVFVVYTRIITS